MQSGHYLGYEPAQGDAIIDTFICDGITDIYTLRQEPANLDTLEVSVGGLMQSDVAYTILTSNGNRDIQIPGVAVDTKIIVRQHGERYAVGTVSADSILTNHIKDDQVTTPKIPDDAITSPKILSLVASKLTGPYPPLDGYSIDRGQYGKWQPTLTTHGTAESGKSYFVDTSDLSYIDSFQDTSGTTEPAIDESFQAHTIHWWDANTLTNDDPPETMIDTVNYKVGTKSMKFDHTAQQLIQVAEVGFDHQDWTFGTDPFTIEMWIRPEKFDNKALFGFAGHSMEMRLDMDASDTDVGHLVWQSNVGTYHQSTATGGTNQLVRGQDGQTHGLIKKNEWAHVAITRNQNNGMTMWVNGINAYTNWNMAKHPTQDDAYGHYQMDTFSAADVLRTEGTYTNVTGTSDGTSTGNPSGGNNDGILPTVGTFDIKVNSSGAVTNVYVRTPGRGHRVDDTITILDSATGGSTYVQGDLIVQGAATTLNTDELHVEDNVVVLNSNITGTNATNAGIEIERGDHANVGLRFNESDNSWEIQSATDDATPGSWVDIGTGAPVTLGTNTATALSLSGQELSLADKFVQIAGDTMAENTTGKLVIGNVGDQTANRNKLTVYGGNSGSGEDANAIFCHGNIAGDTKTFNIEHPLKKGMRLIHGSLEGPEFGMYQRGTLKSNLIVEEIPLPEYWSAMVSDYTVTLTPHGNYNVWIVEKNKTMFKIKTSADAIDGPWKCDWMAVGCRIDHKLEVEVDATE